MSPRLHVVPEAIPIPDVVEGNGELDWALWEDSVALLDSQAQLPELEQVSKMADAFTSVHKHTG